MQSDQLILKNLVVLWGYINPKRQKQFGLLLILMIVSAFAEIISIGAVLPFLAVLTSPDRIFELPTLQPLIQTMGISTPVQLLLPITIFFSLAAFMAGAMRLLLIWANTRLSFITGADIGLNIYRRTLYQPYNVHISRNSSEVITGITVKANNVISQTVLPLLTLISYSIMLGAILTVFLIVDPILALGLFGGFGFIYAFIMLATRKKLQQDSRRIASESTQVIKALQEGLGGIRDVLIDGNQPAYCDIFRKADVPLRQSQGNIVFIGSCPRFALEALGMMLIAVLAYFLAQEPGGIDQAIPVLGVLVVGAQRMLPALQGVYAAWANIQGGRASLRDALELLKQPLPDFADEPTPTPITFKNQIELADVSFRYNPDSPWVLRNINLKIVKGERIGFMGATGSGKSTLLDIIMGLLVPTTGEFVIDSQYVDDKNRRAWQACVAHVPQNIYLSDASIRENIAFGIPKDKIDNSRIHAAAKQAQISEIIEQLEDGYDTFVGEQGVRLSGGQRQRIGIARALYKQANVLIFDEATSALDGGTEQAVMDSIEGLGQEMTILIIAHRLTTLKGCDKIVELNQGETIRSWTYEEIINPKNNL